MWVFTDIADWFDRQKAQANRVLDEAVEAFDYNQGAMIVAAGTHAAMEFGGAFVDLLRLGDGVKQGGWRGWGADGLRAVAIFPVGKATQMARSIKGLKLAKMVPNVSGRKCAWVGSTKALAHIGQIERIATRVNGKIVEKAKGMALVEVENLAEAVGKTLKTIGPIPLIQMVAHLRQIGAKFGAIRKVTSMKQVEQMVPHDGSVVLVAVRGTKIHGEGIRRLEEAVGHMIYVYREWGGVGRVRIMDRTIETVAQRPYASLAELSSGVYQAVTFTAPFEAAVLRNVFAYSVLHDFPKLFIPIPAVVAAWEE